MNNMLPDIDTLMQEQQPKNPSKLAYSVDDISRETTLSKAFVRKEIKSGRLKATKFGRRVLVLNQNLTDYLERIAQ